ncbi:MAG TPA: hypothetical protein VD969_10020 [Symbiobacteriaceae bacterium]|nr:hypothetical protein [Symbiobacteriaceae bacterium]
MAKVLVPIRPYFECVESRYADDASAWDKAIAAIATELARRGGAGRCQSDGSSTDSSNSR